MSNPAYETFGQARQGSVAAIIQVLNESLSDAGIRTRAVVADGMLQLLCEAQNPDQLERETLVSRVRQILENISPQRIRKVKINSRIVKEEQLLWLEEINRDPDNAVLWSQVITLKKPFFIKRWIRDRHLKPAGPIFRDISEPDPNETSLQKKLIGAASLALLVLATGWLFREDLSKISQRNPSSDDPSAQAPDQRVSDLPPLPDSDLPDSDSDQSEAPEDNQANGDNANGDRTANTTPEAPPPNEPVTSPTPAAPATTTAPTAAPTPPPDSAGATADAFAEAVRIANQASTDGLTASTVAEWLDLATRWQRASDLMAQIPEGSEQYEAAKERVTNYADNSESALAQAAAMQ